MTIPRSMIRMVCKAPTRTSASRISCATMATSTTDWESSRYLRFEDQRTRPARDLLAQVPLESPSTILDLGCGPGNSTQVLAQRFPDAQITGMDSSPDMIDKARATVSSSSKTTFELGDLRTYKPAEGTKLIFTNAVFQWLTPNERIPMIIRFLKFLPEKGVFAMQVPFNFEEWSHVAMRQTAFSAPFAQVFNNYDPGNKKFASPKKLYNALKPHCANVDIWHTIYEHRLANPEAIVDWFRSTGLRPFLEKLDEAGKKEFLERYLERIKEFYTPLVDGGVLLRFPRLFMVLTK